MRDVHAVAQGVIPIPDAATDAWLERLAAAIDPIEHALGFDEPPETILRRGPDGAWRVGPVIGDLWLTGRRLRIAPAQQPELKVAPVVGALWCAGVEGAMRHGPPAFHRELPHVGASLRGRLDVRGSVRLRANGSSNVASVYRARDLDNDISRALVAADRALTRQIGHDRWRSRRVREVLPQIQSAVGPRAGLPAMIDLARMRYTPITRPFREVAEMSVRIVLQDPVVTTTERGRPQGILLALETAGCAPAASAISRAP